MVGQLTASFWPVYKRFSSSGQNDVALWGSFSNGDTVLDYCFHLFEANDVVLNLVSPDVGTAGVEGDIPPQKGQETRTLSTNRIKRRRMNDGSTLATLAANSTTLAEAISKQASCGELATLSETLKNLRAADAHPRFIAAVERKLDHILFPAAEPNAAGAGRGDSDAGISVATNGGPSGGGDGDQENGLECFL